MICAPQGFESGAERRRECPTGEGSGPECIDVSARMEGGRESGLLPPETEVVCGCKPHETLIMLAKCVQDLCADSDKTDE